MQSKFSLIVIYWRFSGVPHGLLCYKPSAHANIAIVEKLIHQFGIPQSIVHDWCTVFINTEIINWTKDLGITLRIGINLRPRTAYSPWPKGEIETRNQHIAQYWRTFFKNAGNSWCFLAPKLAFAHSTCVSSITGNTPYEIMFGTKPQLSMSLNLGLHRKKHKFFCSELCKVLPAHSHGENNIKNQPLNNLLLSQFSQILLEKIRDFRQSYSATFEKCPEQTTGLHFYWNRLKLGHHVNVRRKVFYENHQQDLSKNQRTPTTPIGTIHSN